MVANDITNVKNWHRYQEIAHLFLHSNFIVNLANDASTESEQQVIENSPSTILIHGNSQLMTSGKRHALKLADERQYLRNYLRALNATRVASNALLSWNQQASDPNCSLHYCAPSGCVFLYKHLPRTGGEHVKKYLQAVAVRAGLDHKQVSLPEEEVSWNALLSSTAAGRGRMPSIIYGERVPLPHNLSTALPDRCICGIVFVHEPVAWLCSLYELYIRRGWLTDSPKPTVEVYLF
jgi:hypothetical protein